MATRRFLPSGRHCSDWGLAASWPASQCFAKGEVYPDLQRASSYRKTVVRIWSFGFAEPLFPNQYDVLATELMDELHDMFDDSFVGKLFERRMKKLEQKYQMAVSGQGFEKRLETLAQIQDDDGYMVRLEKNSDGTYSFEEANCPISRVAIRYRQVCQCELSLFSALLDAHVERTECMADGGAKCRYLCTERSRTIGAEGVELL